MCALKSEMKQANLSFIKKLEAAKKAAEEASAVVKETRVIIQDTAKVNYLTAEIEKLKVLGLFFLYIYIFWFD